MILTLRPNKNNKVVLRWTKVPGSDLPFSKVLLAAMWRQRLMARL